MKAVKTIEEKKTHYSANDLRLKRYIELDEKIKELTAELKVIKEEIKHRGTYSTQHFVVTVDETTRVTAPGLGILIQNYGEGVRALCKETLVKTIRVMEKEGENENA